MKTNAVRLLDELKIAYELRTYEVDPEDLSAETVAAKIDLPAEQVFKTLVVRGDRNGVALAVVPGNTELDLKALAKASGDRKMEMVPLKEVQPLTGYIRGGVTALAAKREFPVYIEESAVLFEAISVSAGVRGTQIVLKPDDYIRAVEHKAEHFLVDRQCSPVLWAGSPRERIAAVSDPGRAMASGSTFLQLRTGRSYFQHSSRR